MKRNLKLEKQAKADFKELKKIVNENQHLTLEELCDKLGGHNFEEDLFDLNFGCICATIYLRDNKLILGDDVEIWNDEECYLYDSNFDMSEVLKYDN